MIVRQDKQVVLAIVRGWSVHCERLDGAVEGVFFDDAALRGCRVVVVDLQDVGAATASAQCRARGERRVGLLGGEGEGREDEVL